MVNTFINTLGHLITAGILFIFHLNEKTNIKFKTNLLIYLTVFIVLVFSFNDFALKLSI